MFEGLKRDKGDLWMSQWCTSTQMFCCGAILIMPPNKRDVKLMRDLKCKSTPIYMAPCKMVLAEMNKLKT